MKTTKEKREREMLKKLKLKARRIWILHDAPPEPEKIPKWEYELFRKIAKEKCWDKWFVLAKHIFPDWTEWWKTINENELTHWNFDHTTPKSRGKDYKLDPENIQIVSVAWHFWKTNWQVLKVDYPN